MALREACVIAQNCNLNTLEEAVRNIIFHQLNFFPIEEVDKELEELFNEYRTFEPTMLVKEYLNGKESY